MTPLPIVTKYLDDIIYMDGEIQRALTEGRMDDYHRLSTRLCVRAAFLASLLKGLS